MDCFFASLLAMTMEKNNGLSSTSRKLRAILSGARCIRPGSVYDAISIRIAADLGFEVGMFGGSVASLAVLGDPDIALITLTELAEQMRRMSRAAALPVLVDADHGYGNALNVRRTVQELEAAGSRRSHHRGHAAAAGLRREEHPADFAGGRRRQDEGRGRRPQRSLARHPGAYGGYRSPRSAMRSKRARLPGNRGRRLFSRASSRATRWRRFRPRHACRSCSAARRKRSIDPTG